jgi:hypothetical protein
MEWILAGKITCDARVNMREGNVPVAEGQDSIRGLALGKSSAVQGKRSRIASEFDVKLRFEAADSQQAHDRGVRFAQEVTAAFAFVASAPAEIEIGSITSAHPPVTGTEYTMLRFPADQKPDFPPTTVPPKDAAFLVLPKPERVRRALRWIQKSHLTDNALDEFTCLMVAFESVSHLLKAGGTGYPRCPRCQRDIIRCPHCGHSTGSKISGTEAMREFVVQTLGWSQKDWAAVWGWRCRLLHGEADVSADEEHAVEPFLPALEAAVIAAIKKLTGLAPGDSPTRGRYRLPFSAAVLELGLRVG